MRWTVHGERAVYSSPWMSVHLVDVEPPGGPRFEHHAVRLPAPAAGTVLYDPAPDRGILLLYRHRFIGDFWGWEIPAGRIEAGETAEEAARREAIEEVGWAPGSLEPLTTYHHSSGSTDGRFVLFLGRDPHHVGAPTDTAEAERIAWFPPAEVRSMIARGEIGDGLALTALLWCFAFALFDA
ncbi:MAG: NUDIX hydrolase [Acidimicrobiia bacterium]